MTGGHAVIDANNTIVGATPGLDVQIDSDPAVSWANATTLGGTFYSGDHGSPRQFGGGATATGGAADLFYFGNAFPSASMNSLTALATPISPALRALKLRVKPTQNSINVPFNFTVYKNGVSSSLTVTVPSGSVALVSDTTHTLVFADGDSLDLVGTTSGSVASRTIQFTATLQMV